MSEFVLSEANGNGSIALIVRYVKQGGGCCEFQVGNEQRDGLRARHQLQCHRRRYCHGLSRGLRPNNQWKVVLFCTKKPFHLSRSVAHSSLIFHYFRSLLTISFHRNSGRPLGRFPSIFISATARMFFSFTSPFAVSRPIQPSPSHNHRYRFHLCFFQDFPLPIAPFSSLLLPYAFHI